MIYLAYALIWSVSVAAGVYLVTSEHPWFALLILLLAAGINFSSTPTPSGAPVAGKENK